MKQVEYFEIQDRNILFVKYNDNSFVHIDLCVLLGLEMAKEEKIDKPVIEGLEALHHQRIELAKIDISVKDKQDMGYMPFYKTKQYSIIEKELKEYKEIKEIAKHYNWDGITSEIFNVKTDRKCRDLFDSAIINIQEDYRKARAFDALSEEDEKAKKLLSLEIEKNRKLQIIEEKFDIDVFKMNDLDNKVKYIIDIRPKPNTYANMSGNSLTKEEYDVLK